MTAGRPTALAAGSSAGPHPVQNSEGSYGAPTQAGTGQVLELGPRHLERIRGHAEESYPEECCGILVGTRDGVRARVTRVLATDNHREEEARANRFLISPRDILHAQRQAEREHREIIGYYHSHPDAPSKPSEHDREAAWPNVSYLIVAVENGGATSQRSWLLTDDRSAYLEEQIEVASAP